MTVTVTIRDETTTGDILHELPLEFPSEQITVRELIRERVYQEVHDFNRRKHAPVFRGLMQPADAERILHGAQTENRLKQKRPVDWNAQLEKVVEAFSKNCFLILIDDQQATSLEQEFAVHPGTQISFVRLTLLVGG